MSLISAIKDLSAAIAQFRQLQSKDAITPESLGALLQQIVDAIAESDHPHETVTGIDSASLLTLIDSKINPVAATLQGTIASLTDKDEDSDDSAPPALQANGQVAVEVVDGRLCVWGAHKMLDAGYVPYLFRCTKKRNRDRIHDPVKFGPTTNGWHLYGSKESVKIQECQVYFSTNPGKSFHLPAQGWARECATIMHVHIDTEGRKSVPWGRSCVKLYNKKTGKKRMVKLRFAIGFAKPVEHGALKVGTLNLRSNLAEFSVIYDPKENGFFFNR